MNAFMGLWDAAEHERNIRIHLAAILMVAAAGLLLRIDGVRWAILALACGTVLAAEILNTAIERLVDMVTREKCEPARQVKDMAAGAVLIASLFAVVCGIGVFWEPLHALLAR